jgi:hypothetical protein
MKVDELIITPIDPQRLTGNLQMDAGYNILVDGKKLKRCLTDSGEIVEVSEKADVKKALIEFNTDNAYTWRINIGRPGIKRDDIIKWISSHPESTDSTGFRINENQTGAPLYEYTITAEVVKNVEEEDNQKAEVFAKFNLLDDEQRKSVAIHFGVSPWGFERGELRNYLVGFSEGIITDSAEYRKEFLERIDKIMDNITLNIKSGILSGVINDTGNVLILDGEVIGSTVEEAVAVLRQRQDLFSHLERALVKEGKFIVPQGRVEAQKQEAKSAEAASKKGKTSQNALDFA